MLDLQGAVVLIPNIKLGPEGAWYRTQAWKRQRERVIKRDGGRCRVCGVDARTVQHVIPLRKWKAAGGRAEDYPDHLLATLCRVHHGQQDGGRKYT